MYKIIGANQTEYGPVTADQLRQWIAEGRVNAQTLAQLEGETGWKPLSEFPDFAGTFAATPPMGAPSAPGAAPLGEDGRARALKMVTGPAIGLIVIGALVIALGVIGLVTTMVGSNIAATQTGNAELDRIISMSSRGSIKIVQSFLELLSGGFLIFGGLKLKKLESYGICIAALILSMIPCFTSCCCLIGLVIGIWGLIVINKPEVKPYFS
ncbi:MAG: hypothetical protein JWQ71_1586 [Pedosphaera sp.]|nr:hypothetical protein [Pedosphaera sp.]